MGGYPDDFRSHAQDAGSPEADEAGLYAFVCDTRGCPDRGEARRFFGRDWDAAHDHATSTPCCACGWPFMDPSDSTGITAEDEEEGDYEPAQDTSLRSMANSPRAEGWPK